MPPESFTAETLVLSTSFLDDWIRRVGLTSLGITQSKVVVVGASAPFVSFTMNDATRENEVRS